MYLWRRPTEQQIRNFLAAQAQVEFSYAEVGATRNGELPSGYVVDHTRVPLGSGLHTFDRAAAALRNWQHYRFGWIQLHRPQASPAAGQTVGVVARAAGLWVVSACRVVYVVDEDKPLRRFAFAYGTLAEHPERGEERFQVEWRRDDDTVWYDILAFSRPQQWLSRLTRVYVRRKQKQFGRESARAMQEAVLGAAASG